MACELSFPEAPLVQIRVKAGLYRTGGKRIGNAWDDISPAEPERRKAFDDRFDEEKDKLRDDLDGVVQGAMKAGDFRVKNVAVESGSIEVVVAIGAAVYGAVKEFGELCAALREIKETVQPRVRDFLSLLVRIAPTDGEIRVDDTRIEMEEGLLRAWPTSPHAQPETPEGATSSTAALATEVSASANPLDRLRKLLTMSFALHVLLIVIVFAGVAAVIAAS